MGLTIKQLVKGKKTTATQETIYTVPAGTRAIIRQMNFYDATGTDVATIEVGDGTNNHRVSDDVATAASVKLQRQLVLEAGQTLKINATTMTGTLYYIISGAEIT